MELRRICGFSCCELCHTCRNMGSICHSDPRTQSISALDSWFMSSYGRLWVAETSSGSNVIQGRRYDIEVDRRVDSWNNYGAATRALSLRRVHGALCPDLFAPPA